MEGADDGRAWMESDGAAGNSSCTSTDTHTHSLQLEDDNIDILNEQKTFDRETSRTGGKSDLDARLWSVP